MVPNGWKIKSLQDIATISSGGTPSRSQPSYWDNGTIPWVTTAEVNYQTIIDTEQKITKEGLDNSSAKLYPKDTILMAMYGQGKTRGQVAKLGIEASTNQACAAIQLKDNFNVDFYYQLLASQYKKIRHLANSGGQKNLSSTIIKEILVPTPPLPEQQKIAKILTTWDKAIDSTERLIANSKKQKKALMQQLLTGKKRLLDDNGKRFKGEWEEGKLADFAKIKKGKALSKKNIIEGSYPVIAGGKSSPYSHNDFTHENVITVSASGAYAGYVAFFDYKIWASDCSVVEPKTNSDIKFLYYWLRSQQQRIYNLQSGGAQPHVYPKDLEGMKIVSPPIKEQQKIAAVLTNADKEIDLLEQQLADLQQEKKALMQVLLTGKKRVVVDEIV